MGEVLAQKGDRCPEKQRNFVTKSAQLCDKKVRKFCDRVRKFCDQTPLNPLPL